MRRTRGAQCPRASCSRTCGGASNTAAEMRCLLWTFFVLRACGGSASSRFVLGKRLACFWLKTLEICDALLNWLTHGFSFSSCVFLAAFDMTPRLLELDFLCKSFGVSLALEIRDAPFSQLANISASFSG